MGGVLQIADAEGLFDSMEGQCEHQNEEISKGFVLRDENNTLVLVHKPLDCFYARLLDKKCRADTAQ